MIRGHGFRVVSAYIPPEHTLVRYVPWSKLRRDGENDDAVIGVLATAFVLRASEEYLSATWLQFFNGDRPTMVRSAVNAIRASSIDVRTKSGFALGMVRVISDACEKHGASIRVIHEREDDNEAHVAVRRWPRENADLFDLMADEAWAELILNKDIPLN
jgi:hypothetical protein